MSLSPVKTELEQLARRIRHWMFYIRGSAES